MKYNIAKIQRILLLIGILTAVYVKSKAQEIIRTGNPTSLIASTAEIPAAYRYFYTSGFTAGVLKPELPDTDYEKYGDTEAQAEDILKKIKNTLEENGYMLADVFSMKVFVAPDSRSGKYDFAGWNKAYRRYFGTEENPTKPVRATVGVATLVSPTKFIEIEVIAAKKPD